MVKLQELYEQEEEGKRVASEYFGRSDRIAYGRILGWLYRITRYFDEVIRTLGLLNKKVSENSGELIQKYIKAVDSTYENAGDCREIQTDIDLCEVPNQPMSEYNELHKKVFGSHCAWGVNNPFYTLPLAINDLTSCYHSALNELARKVSTKIDRKSYAHEEATEKAKKFCISWDQSSQNFLSHDELYAYQDTAHLRCVAINDKAELRVGSAVGHLTEVNFREDVLRYYDEDDIVNAVMKILLENTGLKCRIMSNETEGVECRGLNNLSEDDLNEVAKVVASATSMDLRIPKLTKFIEKKDKFALVAYHSKLLKVHPYLWRCFKYALDKDIDGLLDEVKATSESLGYLKEVSIDENEYLAGLVEACIIKNIKH